MTDNDHSLKGRSQAGRRRTSAATNRPTLTIEAIRESYDGNWVLVSVTGYDEMHYPFKGKVLAHSPDRMEIHEAFVREKRGEQPGSRKKMFYIFFAEPLLTSGPEFEKAAARIVESLRRALARNHARRGK